MVPKGWKNTIIGKHAMKVGSGVTPKGGSNTYKLSGIPLIRSQNVLWGTLDLSDVAYIDQVQHKKMAGSLVQANDVLLNITGASIGRSTVVPEEVKEANVNQHVCIIRTTIDLHPQFLMEFLISAPGQKQIDQFQAGGNRQGLNYEQIRSFRLVLPPLPEQKKIAQILSTWGKAIETTEQLLRNSQQQKKALMQQLLTGKKRFPGFKGKWKYKLLADVAQIIVSPVDKKSVEGERTVLLCNYTDVYYNNRINNSMEFMQATATVAEINRYALYKGDVIITKDSETAGDIAIPAFVSEDLKGVICGYHLAIIRPNKAHIDGEYLTFLLSTPEMRYYFFTLATGAIRFGLSVSGIEKAQLFLPPIKEQTKIASIFTAADNEIEVFQKKIDFLKQEKKALMQVLLTGKKRVKV